MLGREGCELGICRIWGKWEMGENNAARAWICTVIQCSFYKASRDQAWLGRKLGFVIILYLNQAIYLVVRHRTALFQSRIRQPRELRYIYNMIPDVHKPTSAQEVQEAH